MIAKSRTIRILAFVFVGLALPIIVVDMILATRPPDNLRRAVLIWAICHVLLGAWIAFAPGSLRGAVRLALERKASYPKAGLCLVVFLVLVVGYSTGLLGLIRLAALS